MEDKLYLRPYQWTEHDFKSQGSDTYKLQIRIWGLDKESRKSLLVINNFPVMMYIQPPFVDGIKWDTNSINRILVPAIKRVWGGKFSTKCEYRKLSVFTGDKKIALLKVAFSSMATAGAFAKCMREKAIPGLKGKYVRVLESDIKNTNKLAAMKDLGFSDWLECNGVRPGKLTAISNMDTEYHVDYRTLKPVKAKDCADWKVHPGILSIDIETYAHNWDAFPDSTNPEDYMYMISCVYEKLGVPDSRKVWLILAGECKELGKDDSVTVIAVDSEEEIIQEYARLRLELDPVYLTGYNTDRFDNTYIVNRSRFAGCEIPYVGRLRGGKNEIYTKEWSSSAYGDISITRIRVEGTIDFDLYTKIVRDHGRLRKRTLNFVSKTFLNDTKEEMPYKESFRIVKRQQDALQFRELVYDVEDAVAELEANPDKKIGDLLDIYDAAKRFKSYVDPKASRRALRKEIRDGTFLEKYTDVMEREYEESCLEMDKLGAYCAKDSVLPIELFKKLNCHSILNSLSSVSCVNQDEIYSSGQQASTYALIHRFVYQSNMVIRKPYSVDSSYGGGYVQDPIRGLNEEVTTFDFNSLYPSVMIAHNLCYTTIIPEDSLRLYSKDQYNTYDVEGELVHVIKKEVFEGVIPKLLVKLLGERKEVRRPIEGLKKKKKALAKERDAATESGNDELAESLQAEIDEIDFELGQIDARQLALKVKCNSVYGFMGCKVSNGIMPYMILAKTVTSISRDAIKLTADITETEFEGVVAYGDTDSIMVFFPGLPHDKVLKKCKLMEQEFNGILPGGKDINGVVYPEGKDGRFANGMYFEIERTVRFILCIKKKHYVYVPYNGDDELDTEEVEDPLGKRTRLVMIFKGVPPAKSGTAIILSQLYAAIAETVITHRGIIDCVRVYEVFFNAILNGEVPDSHFAQVFKMGKNYKNENYQLAKLSSNMKQIGRPIEAGEKVETVVTTLPGNVGDKMMLLDVLESQGASVDYEHYIENSFKTVDAMVKSSFVEIHEEYGAIERKVGARRVKLNNGISQCLFKCWKVTGDLEYYRNILTEILDM